MAVAHFAIKVLVAVLGYGLEQICQLETWDPVGDKLSLRCK